MDRNEDNLRGLWVPIKSTIICIILVQEGEKRERERGPENIFKEIMSENFPNMGKETIIKLNNCRASHTL